jgi:hypothetical protein
MKELLFFENTEPPFPILKKTPLKTQKLYLSRVLCKWAHLGSNQGPPDYESEALTN